MEFASRLDDDDYVAVQSKLPDPPSDTPSDNEVSPGNEAIPHPLPQATRSVGWSGFLQQSGFKRSKLG